MIRNESQLEITALQNLYKVKWFAKNEPTSRFTSTTTPIIVQNTPQAQNNTPISQEKKFAITLTVSFSHRPLRLRFALTTTVTSLSSQHKRIVDRLRNFVFDFRVLLLNMRVTL